MKKIILTLILFAGFASIGYSQLLYSATYSTLTNETLLVAGSTDAGSEWFTNDGYDVIYIELASALASTSLYKAYKIDFPTKGLQKIKAYMEGDDSTVYVIAYEEGGASVQVPLIVTGFGTLSYTIDNGATAGYLVRFRGFFKRNL